MIPIYRLVEYTTRNTPIFFNHTERHELNIPKQTTIDHSVEEGIKARYFIALFEPKFIINNRQIVSHTGRRSFRHVIYNSPVFSLPSLKTVNAYEARPTTPEPGHPFPFPYMKGTTIYRKDEQAAYRGRRRIFPGIRDHDLFNSLQNHCGRILRYEKVDSEEMRWFFSHPNEIGSQHWDPRDTKHHMWQFYELLKFMTSNNATNVAHQTIQNIWEKTAYVQDFRDYFEPVPPKELPAEIIQVLYKLLTPTTVGKRRNFDAEESLLKYFGVDINRVEQNLLFPSTRLHLPDSLDMKAVK